MAIGPLSPRARRGDASNATFSDREESIQRQWTFLRGVKVQTLGIYGAGASTGRALVAEGSTGNVRFSETLPSTARLARTGGTITENATLITAALGEYLVTVYGQCTTAGTAGTLTVTLDYTDDIGLTVTGNIISVALTAGNRAYGTAVLRCAGGGIDYNLTVAGATGNPVYAVHIDVLRLAAS